MVARRAAALAEEAGGLRSRLADAEAALAASVAGPPDEGLSPEAGSPGAVLELAELRARLAALEVEKAEWDSYAAAAEAAMDEDKAAAEAAAAAAAAREAALSARLDAALAELAALRDAGPGPRPDLGARVEEAEAEAAEAFERAAVAEEEAGLSRVNCICVAGVDVK